MNKKSNQPYQRKLNVDVLLGEANLENNSHLVPLAEIIVNPNQPRRYFDSQALEGLIESIQAHGILQPLLVQPKTEKGYPLIAGERRYRAAQALGLESVPVNICSLDDQQAWAIALVENLQREDLNPVEETRGILKLLAWKLELTEEEVRSQLHRMQNQAKGKITHNVILKFLRPLEPRPGSLL
jgi:ParB family chromosome partitioning protein